MATSGSLLVVERHARVYRRTWRGSVISTFANPILYLLAMGLGLGSLVDEGGGTTQLDFPYLTWLAPGLLAAATMMTAAGESLYPVMAGMKWNKYYSDALSTPVSTRDLVLGHFGWLTLRILFTAVVFTGVMVAFGSIGISRAMLVIPPSVLAGLAFAGPVIEIRSRNFSATRSRPGSPKQQTANEPGNDTGRGARAATCGPRRSENVSNGLGGETRPNSYEAGRDEASQRSPS